MDDLGAPRVLVVDDEPQIHRFLGPALRAAGYEPLRAETAAEGLRLAAERAPALVLLDLGLPDGVTDAEYLRVLRTSALPALDAFRPDLLLYLAGADVLAGDRFGRFALTLDGVRERNRTVLTWAREAGIPTVTMMAGGYNRDHALTVEAHASVVLDGLDVFS